MVGRESVPQHHICFKSLRVPVDDCFDLYRLPFRLRAAGNLYGLE